MSSSVLYLASTRLLLGRINFLDEVTEEQRLAEPHNPSSVLESFINKPAASPFVSGNSANEQALNYSIFLSC